MKGIRFIAAVGCFTTTCFHGKQEKHGKQNSRYAEDWYKPGGFFKIIKFHLNHLVKIIFSKKDIICKNIGILKSIL